ncbi:hypothetical protein BST81_15675 [Leptolyngbya sp. 'hensonii']|uniref:STAS domain-containing protein n=1 Tax=Leptolyngbya sp. 'hensonii' TaxID=1922337 RepID=UPI00094FABED|nr:STAS domain-containing protein [Leptolyngbya sp. 'hensonii']OLP17257.1 hypothetical protein BST81_15675 [Leptolyngbya sp. 'hensonii']
MSSTIRIAQPSGILDGIAASQLRQEVNTFIEDGADTILIDLKDVTFMDSSGLGALVIILKAVRSAGKRLCLSSVSDQVKMLFELTSMDRIFEIFPDQEAFSKKTLGMG